MTEPRNAEQAATGAELRVGDRVRATTHDWKGQTAVIRSIFETPWDTKNKGAGNTRTVAEVLSDPGVESPIWEHIFLDQLEKVDG